MDELQGEIVGYLGNAWTKATFVTELHAALATNVERERALEEALSGLEIDGRVLVRAHFCGDPHLRSVDLRIASLIDEVHDVDAGTESTDDPINLAVKRNQAVWDEWITEFLRNHRCQ